MPSATSSVHEAPRVHWKIGRKSATRKLVSPVPASDIEEDTFVSDAEKDDAEKDALFAVLAFVEFGPEEDTPSVGNATVVVDVDVLPHRGRASYIWRPPQQALARPTPQSSQSKRHLPAQENQRIGIGGLVVSSHQEGMLKLLGKL